MSGRLRRAVQRHPRRRVFLHIGAMKTGTTYLQRLMDDNRHQLADAGYLFPGETWADQWRGVLDVLAVTSGKTSRGPETDGMWEKVATEIRDHPGPASVVSMEFLSYASAEQAAAIVSAFPEQEVHVVLTVRDARSSVPAQWQTSCRMTSTIPFPKFVTAMGRPLDRGGRGRAARLLARTQDIRRMLHVWTSVVGADHVHVVTVPGKGADPTLLWTRFAAVIGLDPSVCTPTSEYIHTSLGLTSTELLRLLNVALGRDVRAPETRRIKRELIKHLSQRAASEPRISLNRRGLRLAAAWNGATRTAITETGVHLVGDLDDLPVDPPPASAPKALRTPSVQELLETAVAARSFLETLRNRLSASPGEALVEAEEGQPVVSRSPNDEDAHIALEAAVEELATLVRACIELHRDSAAPLR